MDVLSYLIGKKSGGGSANLQSKEVAITENKTTNITPDTGYDGLSAVSVTTNVPGSSLNWEALGYNGEPSAIENDYNYSKNIKDNWVPAISLNNKCKDDRILTYFPLVDTSITTNMSNMFYGCYSLKSVALLNTENVTNMSSMFNSCFALYDVPLFNTSNVTNMSTMFSTCNYIKAIPLFNTSRVTNMSSMFNSCTSLETAPLFDTSNVTNMSTMFSYCHNLKTVPLFNTSEVTNFTNAFSSCLSLTNESLDNILQMCINATKYNGVKTLARLGFESTNYHASRIEALPHYQDFIDAGWIIGY